VAEEKVLELSGLSAHATFQSSLERQMTKAVFHNIFKIASGNCVRSPRAASQAKNNPEFVPMGREGTGSVKAAWEYWKSKLAQVRRRSDRLSARTGERMGEIALRTGARETSAVRCWAVPPSNGSGLAGLPRYPRNRRTGASRPRAECVKADSGDNQKLAADSGYIGAVSRFD
jgi:hypothetical protein